MRKDNVWKQAIALVLSAALVLGNASPVSAAAGDTAAGDAGTTTEGTDDIVSNSDAYKALTFDFENGEMAADSKTYTENGISFANVGVEVVDAPIVSDDDGGHGKVLRFSNKDNDNTKTGETYLTTVAGALSKYDYSIGATFSFDFYPEVQSNDWNYLFGIGKFEDPKYALVGTIGFSAGLDSEEKRLKDGESWQAFYPGMPNMGWITENKGSYEWDYFKQEVNAHKWYNIKYIYTVAGMTIAVNDVPIVSYRDTEGYMENILKNLSGGQLRLGKGVVPSKEGYVGLMDNIKVEPMAPHPHEYEDENPEGVVITEPTCTEIGTKQMPECTICHVLPVEIIPALGHDYGELVEKSDATCKDYGYKAHYECKRSDCSQWAVADETAEGGKREVPKTSENVRIPKLDDNFDAGVVTKKATPDADGEITKTCNNRTPAHTKTEVIAKASDISLVKTSYTYTGSKITPKVTVKDSEGKIIDASNYTVTYTNNTNPGTATATIAFNSDKYEGSVPKTFKITADLSLNKSTVTLYTGKASNTVSVKPTVTGPSKTVSWTTDKPKVAKVDKNGKITAVGKGTANIKATANGITQVVKVTVKNPTITVKNGKKKASSVTVKKKKSVKLTVSTNPKNAGTSVKKLSKKDAKTASVTFKKGKLTIKGKKKGTIKVKITSGKTTKTLTVKVK